MKYLFATVTAIFFTVLAQAQIKATKVVIQTPTVNCNLCKKRLESYVMREAGVVEVNVNYRKKTTTVKFMSDRTNLSNIRATINNCGYDADGEKANEDSYKKLPKDCKKVEDGGLTDKEHRKKELESEDNK